MSRGDPGVTATGSHQVAGEAKGKHWQGTQGWQQGGLPCWGGGRMGAEMKGRGPKPLHPHRAGDARGATLTEAQGLPADPHHPPQLPAGAGQQQVTGEPAKRGGAECRNTPNPPSRPPEVWRPGAGTGTYRFWVSASITMEM